jgi:hypothetical protein
MFFKNFDSEAKSSPAIMMTIWGILFVTIVINITGFMDIIFLTVCAVLFFIDFKKYKKKY